MNGDSPGARQIMAALRGDSAAMAQVVGWAVPRLSGKVDRYRREIKYRHEHEWNAEQARERAMAGDVPAEQTVGALSDIQQSLIRVLALTPAALMADENNVEQINEMWSEAVLTLLLRLHNPTIKYGLIGGLEPELREPAEEYVERYNREIWGTIEALASDSEVSAEDFPPETGNVIQAVAEARRQTAQQGDD